MLDRLVRAFALKVWQLGLWGALRFSIAYLLRGNTAKRQQGGEAQTVSRRRDVLDVYGMVIREAHDAFGNTAPDGVRINWVIPPFSIGSGGHMTIFRMISMLESHGFRQRIYITGKSSYNSAEVARRMIVDHFTPLNAEVVLGAESMGEAEFVFATSWDTVYWVDGFNACNHRLYFVQDFEPFFYPHGSEYALAEETYRKGLIGITAGQWLADKLARKYGMQTAAFGFSYDKDLHFPRPFPGDGKKKVFFYARHVTPRRGFELGVLALTLLHRRMPDIEFIMAGWDVSEFHLPFPCVNAGVVAHKDLPVLFAQSDAALVLSLTNLSLLPLEIMACGCPVVSNRGDNVEWMLQDGENAILCDSTPQAMANALERLLTDEDLRQRIAQNGMAYAEHTDWQIEGERVAGYLEALSRTGALPQ